MGIIRISKKYKRWMRDTSFLNPEIYHLDTPEKMLDYYKDFFHRRRIDMSVKDCNGFKQSRMTTSRNERILLDCEWPRFSTRKKATVLAHEAVHYRQRDRFGGTRFELKYISDARFRVAMEASAYRESMFANFILGASEDWCRRYAKRIPGLLRRNYFIPTLNYDNVKRHVIGCMVQEFNQPWRAPKRKPRRVRNTL